MSQSAEDTIWDREADLGVLRQHLGHSAFGYVLGRRRIGKSSLLRHACHKFGGLYHQAIEGTPEQQLTHLITEWRDRLPALQEITPHTWPEFFHLLSREKLPPLIVFDEWPYWVSAEASLPSILQKWVDQQLPQHKTLLMISGSSQSMLFSQFLQGDAPLYGRAKFCLRLQSLSYSWFCKALGCKLDSPATFERYAVTGGVPHYWKLLDKKPWLEQIERLFFQPSAILAEEPRLILHDEGVTGNVPKAMLDLIGRGVSKPGEVASRLGMPQGHLSRPLALLTELGLVQRELPFGESTRTSKRVQYSVQDAALSFYYGTCLPHGGHWDTLSRHDKEQLLHQHASRQWEIFCRSAYPGAGRHWENQLEIDIVAPLAGGRHLIAECKWTRLRSIAKLQLQKNLENKFLQSTLKSKITKPTFRIFDEQDLTEIADLQEKALK